MDGSVSEIEVGQAQSGGDGGEKDLQNKETGARAVEQEGATSASAKLKENASGDNVAGGNINPLEAASNTTGLSPGPNSDNAGNSVRNRNIAPPCSESPSVSAIQWTTIQQNGVPTGDSVGYPGLVSGDSGIPTSSLWPTGFLAPAESRNNEATNGYRNARIEGSEINDNIRARALETDSRGERRTQQENAVVDGGSARRRHGGIGGRHRLMQENLNENTEGLSRKRNRLNDLAAGIGFSNNDVSGALEVLLTSVQILSRTCVGDLMAKDQVEEAAKKVAVEVAKLQTKVIQKVEENAYLLQQILHLQSTSVAGDQGTASSYTTPSYAEVARSGIAADITGGKRLPGPRLLPMLRMAPAERTMIIKRDNKDGVAPRQEQAAFREKLKSAVGEDLVGEISAVRPTRHGGYTIITASEAARDQVAERVEKGVDMSDSRIVRPNRKTARMCCRAPPDMTPNEFIKGMYNRHNPELQKIPQGSRTATVNITRLGWIFSMSTAEAIACHAQGGRVRHSFGLEARLEEFIPLQQCYNCCGFGHEARNCLVKKPKCRLCGKDGHCGRSCPTKDDRATWSCYNCIKHNTERGTNLPTKHAAAQLHLCAIATREKDVKKEQLRSAGVYTLPPNSTNPEIINVKSPPRDNMAGRMTTQNRVGEVTRGLASTSERSRRTPPRDKANDRTERGLSKERVALGRGGRGSMIRNKSKRGEVAGRVRWQDGESEESASSKNWMGGGGEIARGRGRNIRGGRPRNNIRTPGTPNPGRIPSEGLTTPGSGLVHIHSDMEDDDLDD